MKLRIKGNSIRIRLSRSEVDQFGKEGYLEERTEFAGNALIYALRDKNDATELTAFFADNTLTVYVPSQITQEWTISEKVGYENNMQTGEGKQLFILIEKDFKCIDNTTEDQSDNYEHPTSACN